MGGGYSGCPEKVSPVGESTPEICGVVLTEKGKFPSVVATISARGINAFRFSKPCFALARNRHRGNDADVILKN
jgi:hypothetical protein